MNQAINWTPLLEFQLYLHAGAFLKAWVRKNMLQPMQNYKFEMHGGNFSSVGDDGVKCIHGGRSVAEHPDPNACICVLQHAKSDN